VDSELAGDTEVELQTVAGPPSRPWLTLALTLVAMVVYLVVAVVAVLVLFVVELVRNPRLDVQAWAAQAEANGDLLSIGTWSATFAVVPLVLLFARVVSGPFAREHLGLRANGFGSLIRWILIIFVYLAMIDGFTWLIGRDVVPDWMIETYAAAQMPILLWLTLIVAAPVGEELLFRGFLFPGLGRSRLGPIGAAIISSLLWACLHLQYDWYGISSIFLGGLVLAAARRSSGSLYPCIAMHAVMNLVATLELLWSAEAW
jgi:membrane protease YdiL (CAAX protease family)